MQCSKKKGGGGRRRRRGRAGYEKQQNSCQHIKINQLTVFQSPELLTKDNKRIFKPAIQPALSDTILFFHKYISHRISFHPETTGIDPNTF